MSIVYKMDQQGGFYAGDTETGRASYAYPTSTHATIARRMPERVAAEMVQSANRFADSMAESACATTKANIDAYHARMWDKLYGRESV